MWSDQYLRSLAPAARDNKSRCNLKEGSVVLIRKDNVPRMNWPLGLVLKLYPGKDGLVRSVLLRTKGVELTRSVQRLYDLEITTASDTENNDCTDEQGTDMTSPDPVSDKSSLNSTQGDCTTHTRSGRVVRQQVQPDFLYYK